MNTITQGMIFAAGLGTRFKPWTDQHPKALAVINGKSLLQRNIEYLQQYGIDKVIVNVHHFAGQITQAIQQNKGWGSQITISDETDAVLETGGGLKKAAHLFGQTPVVIINVDILTDFDLEAMIHFHQLEAPLATLAITNRVTSRYFLFDECNTLCGWRNTKTGEEKISRSATPLIPKAFSGVHIIEPALFPLITQEGKFSIVDVYLQLAREHTIKGFDHSYSKFIDVGKPEAVAIAEDLFP
ncbi:nucleotidyltransferase family protein [Pseudoflavitalea sp. X16]|uniref:nucleotidyltransferase family protein n=1 Tax=Paraflavitalea devenefica TaxID=2716334 RepID=UPI00141FF2E1|nr:nucleotidyltransferase family protein [Paraflavitalea devenefica]NII24148.1 nucleotidyltransferase family protein [Paraflavitalea devenefica]